MTSSPEPIDTPGCPTTAEPAATPSGALDPSAFVRDLNDTSRRLDLLVRGARCAGCLSKIEKGVAELPGVSLARLNLTSGHMRVEWSGDLDPARIPQTLVNLGYEAQPYDPGTQSSAQDTEGRFLLRCLAVSGFAAANIMLLSVAVWSSVEAEMGEAARGLMHWVSAVIALPAAAYAGRPFFRSAWRVLKNRHTNMDVPISLAILLALGISIYEAVNLGEHAYFDAAVMLLFFLLIGRYLDHRLRARARSAAEDLLAMQALTARRIEPGGSVAAVQAREIMAGDAVLLVPGDRVPADGTITDGLTDMDTSLVTGESQPVTFEPGSRVHAGMINLSKQITMRAEAGADASLIAQLADLIETGAQSKAAFVRLADKAAKLYVPVVHSLAAVTFILWWVIWDMGVHQAVLTAAAVLIITCPCALGLAVPAVQTVIVGRLFRLGVLVKSGDALERLAEATHIVFDKTGTLTLGQPRLLNTDALSDEALEVAARLARASRHPLARVIAERAGKGLLADGIEETPGKGLSGFVGGVPIRLGRAEFVGVDTPDSHTENSHAEPGQTTQLWFKMDGTEPVCLRFEDALRSDAAKAVNDLQSMGLTIEMLSGDLPGPAERVAGELGIDNWQARLSPAEKADHLIALKETGAKVLMVGDGLNDAPSLSLAHVSMSPGTAADASQAAADFVFQGQKLSAVVHAVRAARVSRARILQNFGLAAGYNALAIPIAVFGFVTPLIAAIAMSASSVVVTLNALRPSALASQPDLNEEPSQ